MADPAGQPVIDGLVTRQRGAPTRWGDATIHWPPLDRLRLELIPMSSHYDVPAPADGSCRMTIAAREASGSVNRSFSPESVRHVSVTIVAQRPLLTDKDRG
jgi:hypothetical protein